MALIAKQSFMARHLFSRTSCLRRELLNRSNLWAATRPRSRMLSSTTDSGTANNPADLKGFEIYETVKAVDEYLQFHFAPDSDLMPYAEDIAPKAALGFKERCAALCLSAKDRKRALDVGCAVGGMSFELATQFEEVVGIDFSHAFIDKANEMKQAGSATYKAILEARITEERLASVNPKVDRSRVHFSQGDACDLPADLGSFDAVLAANLLCRLPEPVAFLKRCSDLVKPGGVLVLVSPYSWLPSYTAPEKWLGGKAADGKKSFDVVSEILTAGGFKLLAQKDVPFLIREHNRKYQWGCSDGTVWCRV